MKQIKEYIDGYRWIDGDTSSAPFEKDSDTYNEKLSEGFELVELSQAEKDAHALSEARAKFKAERAIAVAALTITTEAGNVFDADETSQGRMARAVVAMEAGDVIQWVLSDNSIVDVDASELKEALKLAGAAQSALWS